MLDSTPDAGVSASAFQLLPVPALALPAGFNRWQDSPPDGVPIKAVLVRPCQYRLASGTRARILASHPGWNPYAWQRLPQETRLPLHWHAFPDALPAAGAACRVVYFDLHGREPEQVGQGRYRGGWPFGDFVERRAGAEGGSPEDATRWAPFAWRPLDSLGMGRPLSSADKDIAAGGSVA
jgi:hypothetical protein